MNCKKINFVCPECGSDALVAEQEVIETVYVDGLWNDDFFEYGDVQDSEVLETLAYMCGSCKFPLPHNYADAVKWLKEHNMVGEETIGC